MKSAKKTLILLIGCFFTASLIAQVGTYRAPNTAAPNLGAFSSFGTYVGDSAGRAMFSGFYCTLIGHRAGFNLNNDSDNTIVGSDANVLGFTGIDNVLVGARAGYRNRGSDMVIVGNMAGYHNTTGFDNVFIGEDAGYQNTSGTDNVFMGEDAGYNNTNGFDNTFLGNTAGRQNTSGYRNTAIGNEALFDLGGFNQATSHHNTAVGDSAGIDNGIGNYNTFMGAASGAANENANHNTFIGAYAGYDNDRVNTAGTASRNTYLGYRCGYSNRQGQDNVGVGAFANTVNFVSISRIRNRTTFLGSGTRVWADDVVSIGYQTNARKQFGIALGTEANSDGQNSIAIGYQTSVTTDNVVRIGNSAMVTIGGIVNWTATSDGRIKSDIQENIPGLAFIEKLRPVSYQMDLEKEYALRGDSIPDGLISSLQAKKDIRYTGFIAQEVESAAHMLGYDFSGVDPPEDSSQLYGLRYAEFVGPLVRAVQELNEKVDQQNEILQRQALQIEAYETLLSQSQEQSRQVQEMLIALQAKMILIEEQQGMGQGSTKLDAPE